MPSTRPPTHAEVEEWLSDENNRGDHGFLNSVHNWRLRSHSGHLTAAQTDAVANWMRQAGWRPDDAGATEDIDRGPADISDADVVPARAGEAVQVPNGVYAVVRSGQEPTEIMIHTITYSQRTPSLVGKRVVSILYGSQRQTLGYLTTQGSLRLWVRNRSLSASPEVLAVHRLLATLRDSTSAYRQRILRGYSVSITDEVGAWHIRELKRYCYFCNSRLNNQHLRFGDCGCPSRNLRVNIGNFYSVQSNYPHDNESMHNRYQATDNYCVSRMTDPAETSATGTSAVQEVFTPSECGVDWEQ